MTDWPAAFFADPAAAEFFGDAALLKWMGAVETALVEAQAECGIVPAAAARTIAASIEAAAFDVAALKRDGARAGTLVIPYVKALTAQVRARDPAAAGWVHYGATSQDIVDSVHALQTQAACALIALRLRTAAAAAGRLAQAHRAAPMLGRTVLQPATPIPFGLKAAQWRLGVVQTAASLADAARQAATLQFGGAAGSLGALGTRGGAVAPLLAARLGLALPPAPWHARRAGVATLAAQLAIAIGASAKIAGDVILLSQFEVAECFEPAEAGRGGSSAMPHKRNPVRCMQIRAAHARAPALASSVIAAMDQEHERAAGGWQAEWAILPDLLALACGASANLAAVLEGLVVDPVRMRANLDALLGLPMTEAAALALAPALGRDVAHSIVEEASRVVVATRRPLAEALKADPRVTALLSAEAIDALCEPERAFGSSDAFIDAALAAV